MISAKARYTTLDVAFGSMTNACASRDLIKSPPYCAKTQPESRRSAMVILEEATKSLTAFNVTFRRGVVARP